jgi:regulator of protease activity HflC (stomatin/prohibitin superfamily)
MNSGVRGFLVLALLIGLVYGVGYELIFRWGSCRVYCPPGRSLQIARQTGETGPRDAYAPEGAMGVQGQLGGPGRHFFNPWDYEVTVIEDVVIPPGKVGVVKNQIGKDLPPGRFLAEPGEKGTQRQVLSAGQWRVNLHGQRVEVVDATIIRPGYVGVQTAREGQHKGTLDQVLQPGYYNINPQEVRVDIVEVGFREWSMKAEFVTRDGRQEIKRDSGVSFPLADGKEMYLDFTVIWGISPRNAPRIIREYGTIAMVEAKVIEPQVLSICKNLGSNLTTMQFIEGDSRETFQEDVTKELQKMGREKGMDVLIALVRGFHPAEDIKNAIQARMLAEEETKTLKVEQETDLVAARLEQARKMVDVAVRDFDAETSSLTATEREVGLKKAAELKAKANREVAALDKQRAILAAEGSKIEGEAKAQVTEWLRRADAQQLDLQIKAFGGAPAFNLYTFAQQLPAEMRIRYRYAGPGTLWTDPGSDLEKASAQKLLEFLEQQQKGKR